MPLVWAHAEFIKLLVSRHLGHPLDRPRAVWQRYRGRKPRAGHAFWSPHAPIDGFAVGMRLAIALPQPASVRWGHDGWREVADVPTLASGLGFHLAILATERLPPDAAVEFTWRWQQTDAWQGTDYAVKVMPPDRV
jgi:glucoamylase